MIAFLPIEYLANECDHVILGSLFNILFFLQGIDGNSPSPVASWQVVTYAAIACVKALAARVKWTLHVFRLTKG
jgi:hypothetical protein